MIPIASGSQLTKIDKGLQELIKLGLVEDKPYKIFGAQAEGCSPVSVAYKAGHDVYGPEAEHHRQVARHRQPGRRAVRAGHRAAHGWGLVEDVNDEQVVDAITLLARTEGIFAETAGGVTVGVTKKLIENGLLDPTLTTVVLNTGDGLKTLDAVAGTGLTATIRPASSPSGKLGSRKRRRSSAGRWGPSRAVPRAPKSPYLTGGHKNERFLPHPHHPAHLHRWSGRGDGRGCDPR